MAILILTARSYGQLLQTACDGFGSRSLKLRREVQKLLAPKHKTRNMKINLSPEQSSALTGAIYEEDFIKRGHQDTEGLRLDLEKMAGEENTAVEVPYVAYSISEWKAIVEIASGQESVLDVNVIRPPVIYNMSHVFEKIKPTLLRIFADAYGMEESKAKKIDAEELNKLAVESQTKVSEEFAALFGVIPER